MERGREDRLTLGGGDRDNDDHVVEGGVVCRVDRTSVS